MSAAESHKVVLVGDLDVGKTTLFNRFKLGEFVESGDEKQTRQEAECSKTWEYKGETFSITLFDTAGMERFEGTLPPTYFRNAFSVIFMYALNSQESINNIPSWADSVSVQHIGDQGMRIVKALVGNKSDLEDEREITESRAQETAEKSGIEKDMVFEISAKEGDGVDEMFATIGRAFKGTENKSELSGGSGGTFPTKAQQGKKQCCS